MSRKSAGDIVLEVLRQARVLPTYGGRYVLAVHSARPLPHGGATWAWSVQCRTGPGPRLVAGSRLTMRECAEAPYWALFEHADGTTSVIPFATRAGRQESAALIMAGQPEPVSGRCPACGYRRDHPVVSHEECREQAQWIVVRYKKARNWFVDEEGEPR